MDNLTIGVCCALCYNDKQGGHCPVGSASSWSRHANFCSEYTPDTNNPEALEMVITTKAQEHFKGGS